MHVAEGYGGPVECRILYNNRKYQNISMSIIVFRIMSHTRIVK